MLLSLVSLSSLTLGIAELLVTFILPLRRKAFENVDSHFSRGLNLAQPLGMSGWQLWGVHLLCAHCLCGAVSQCTLIWSNRWPLLEETVLFPAPASSLPIFCILCLLHPTDPNETSWLFCGNVSVQLPSQLQNAVINPEEAWGGRSAGHSLWAGTPCIGLFPAVSLRVG